MPLLLEYEISLDKLSNDYLFESDMLCINIMEFSTDTLSRNMNLLAEKGKMFLQKIVEAFKTFVRNLWDTASKFFTKKKIQFRIGNIRRMIKKCPKFGNEKVTILYDPSGKKDRDRQLLEVQNMLTKIKLYKNDQRMLNLIEMIERDRERNYPSRVVTINQALEIMEPEIERLDSELKRSLYNLIHMVDTTSSPEDPVIQKLISKIANILHKDDLILARNITTNLGNIFSTLKKHVKTAFNYARRGIKTVYWNKIEGRDITSYKPIRWVEQDGLRVPVFHARGFGDNGAGGSPAISTTYNPSNPKKQYPIIIVYDPFFDWDKDLQDVVLLHEVGHIAKAHFTANKLRDTAADLKELQRQQKVASTYFVKGASPKNVDNSIWAYIFGEVEADEYAIQHGGNKQSLDDLLLSFFGDVNEVEYLRTKMR